MYARTLFIAALVLAPSARAYAFSAPGPHWPNQHDQPVTYRLQPDGSADVPDDSDLNAIRHAFSTWQSVACSYLTFMEQPWMEPKRVANDGFNEVFWIEQQGEWQGTPATLALTYTFYRTEDNIITDADITVNGVNWSYTTSQSEIGTGTPAKVDLETVLFHEIGHFFGLAHSQDPSAAMYPSNNKPMQRDPANDDIQGICSLYPNGMPIPDPMHPGAMGAPVGAPCSMSTDCSSNRCAQDPVAQRSYCTQQCDPSQANQCPTGYECGATTEGNYCLAPAMVDELCDKCDEGQQCSTGFCTAVPNVNNNRPFCSRPCDPTPGQPAQCPAGYSCMGVVGAVGGACAPNDGVCAPVGKGGQNEVCFANGTCKAGFTCVEFFPNSGLNYCYYGCDTQFIGQSCTQGGGTRCDSVVGRMDTAVCFSVSHEGQPCIPEICDPTSFCAFDENVGVDSAICYRMCNSSADCGAQSQCQAFPGIPNLCVPLEGFKYEAEACTSDNECRSHTCRTYGANRLCTAACATTDPASCGAGLKCVPQSESTQGLCWPEAYIDKTARGPIVVRPDFCACDFSNGCDPNCACDPECGGGCGCTSALPDDRRGTLAFGVLVVLMIARSRVRRR